MNNDSSSFFPIISIIADGLTFVSVITAALLSLKKHQNLLSFKISIFLGYLIRTCCIAVIGFVIYNISEFIYNMLLVFFTKESHGENCFWEKGKEIQHIFSYFISIVIGLSLLWMVGSAVWTNSLNTTKEFINFFLSASKKLKLNQVHTLEILSATYGSDSIRIDVVQTLRNMVANNKLTIKAGNDIGGDPHRNIVKNLK